MEKNKCPKFGHFIANAEDEVPTRCFGSIRQVAHFESRVVTADADVCDADLALGATTNHDFVASRKVYYVNRFRGAIGNRFDDHVLVAIFVDVEHEQREVFASFGMLHQVLIKGLANLTFKTTPNVRINEGRLLFVLFALQPFSDAF